VKQGKAQQRRFFHEGPLRRGIAEARRGTKVGLELEVLGEEE